MAREILDWTEVSGLLGSLRTGLRRYSDAFRSGGIKVASLPLTAVLSLISTGVVIERFGPDGYASFGLVIGLVALVPFADLGLSAGVVNAIAKSDEPTSDPAVVRALSTALRLLLFSAVAFAIACALISLFGLWPRLLGDALGPRGNLGVGLCAALFAVSIPTSIGFRVLTGLGLNHRQVLIQSLQSPVALIALIVVTHFGGREAAFLAPVTVYVGMASASVVAFFAAGRSLAPAMRSAVRQCWSRKLIWDREVVNLAGPMLVQMIALPVSLQSARLVLSHVSSPREVAAFSLGTQVFGPVWQVVSVAALALWPMFVKQRAQGERPPAARLALVFGLVAALASGLLLLLLPFFNEHVGRGEVSVPWLLAVAFSIYMTLQGVKAPIGMVLTDAWGLRAQAILAVGMIPVTLGMSLLLSPTLGAIGCVIAMAGGVLCLQVVGGGLAIARRGLRRMEA